MEVPNPKFKVDEVCLSYTNTVPTRTSDLPYISDHPTDRSVNVGRIGGRAFVEHEGWKYRILTADADSFEMVREQFIHKWEDGPKLITELVDKAFPEDDPLEER